MYRRDKEVLSELLHILAETDGRWRTKPLTAFAGLRGSADLGELMVIGRAVNGWTQKWNAGDPKDADERIRIVDKVFRPTGWNDGRPMLWVTDHWMARDGCNTKKSAFWRVIRATVDRLGIADVSARSWPSTLCWTNLYKISPFEGGNPSKRLADAQLDKCIQILNIEISDWKPRRLLFLTGYSWAKPFLEGLGWEPDFDGHMEEVEAVGSTSSGARIVVAPHPQGRREGQLVAAIAEAYGVS